MTDYNRQVIEEHNISDNLKVSVSVSFDEMQVYLDVDYMNGKFTIQKSFTNNYIGLEELAESKKDFVSEESIRKYLNL